MGLGDRVMVLDDIIAVLGDSMLVLCDSITVLGRPCGSGRPCNCFGRHSFGFG